MKILYHWVKEFIDIPFSAPELADKLTSLGLEIEEVEEIKLPSVIVGEVLKVSPHPNADKLSVCEVFTGKEKVQVVCGAPNVREGIKSPLALVGAVLPGGMKIEKRKIRGVESTGMLCSEKELAVGEDASGIWILPPETRVGEEIYTSLGLEDWVLDISVTPNRGDCLSVLGIAREIRALTGEEFKMPEYLIEEIEHPAKKVEVEVKEPELCPRYTLRIIENARVKESPLKIRWRLKLCDIRSINNIVDVTNYVMLELGQPLHAFDMDKIKGRKILIRKANPSETLITLDGVSRGLSPEDLVIADGEKPVALAGVMGGEESEISQTTRNILLESACFQPQSIRKTSRRYGLVSESSYRFERGVDWGMSAIASDRAAYLIGKFAEGKPLKGFVDVKKKGLEEKQVSLRPERVGKILGKGIPDYERILSRLGFICKKEKKGVQVSVPSFRYDIEQEIDLIEEIARIHGYDNFPSTLPEGGTPPFYRNEEEEKIDKIRNILLSMGLWEVLNYSFVPLEIITKLNFPLPSDTIRMDNPLSGEWEIMRFSLLPGLIQVGMTNLSRGNHDLKMFEVGKVYMKKRNVFREEYHAGGLLAGIWQKGGWKASDIQSDLFQAKGIVERLWEEWGEDFHWEEVCNPLLEPALALKVGDKEAGIIGELKEEVRDRLDLDVPLFLWEVYVHQLADKILPKRYEELPKFPPLKRDLSLVLKEEIPCQAVEQLIRESAGELLKDVYLFNLYRGKPIPKGFKSFTYSLIFQKKSGTLTDKEGEKIMAKIKKRLSQEGIEIRQ
ncbi:MAG: phenylalanine--tRNA ligase subunit beta [Caldiserica bacterium]|nr:phenylalanine--tRNA ligase subunit beta [Caldisericota bacterium]